MGRSSFAADRPPTGWRQSVQWRRGNAVLLGEGNVEQTAVPQYFGSEGGVADRMRLLFDFVLNSSCSRWRVGTPNRWSTPCAASRGCRTAASRRCSCATTTSWTFPAWVVAAQSLGRPDPLPVVYPAALVVVSVAALAVLARPRRAAESRRQ